MSELRVEHEILDSIKNHLGDKMTGGEVQRERRITIRIKDPAQRDVITFAMKAWQAWHLICISGVDTQENIELVYHFDARPPSATERAITVNMHVVTDRDQPRVATVSDLIPASGFFEREAHDMLGVVFDGNQNLDRLILPDDWPEGVYPLRKDFLLDIQKKEQESQK